MVPENTNAGGVNKSQQGSMFDLHSLYELFIQNWKWFVLSSALCVGAMAFYLFTVTPVYQRCSVLMVKEDGQQKPGILSNLLSVQGSSSGQMGMGGGIDNELYILSSYQLMRQVVDVLKLDVQYHQKQGLRTVSLYNEIPFEVQFTTAFAGPVSFDIKEVRKEGLLLTNFKMVEGGQSVEILKDQLVAYNDSVMTPVGQLMVVAKAAPIDRELQQPIQVSRMDKRVAAGMLRGRISTSAVAKMGTLVNIICSDTNPVRAEDILTAIMETYRKTLIDDKNRAASRTAEFIEERINIIGRELGDVEDKLTDFKSRHELVDIQAKVTTSMAEGARAKDKSVELGAQLNVAQYVRDFVTDVSKSDELIPNVSGLRDAGVELQISQYNELLLRRNRLLANSGEQNSVVQELNKDLDAMRSTIEGSLSTYCNTLSLRIEDAQKQEAETKESIKEIPLQEKKVLDVKRQQAIKERLYTFLLQNREEIAMKLAGTEANLRVVEAPYGSLAPSSPHRKLLFLIAFLVGLVIPFVLLYIREFFNMGVRGRKDIMKYTNIPILGDIPTREKGSGESEIVVTKDAQEPISEAFRLLRTNLEFMQRCAQVIMFTSTMAHEGKTFISRNFAVTLALTGKRVILVDMDLRKGKQGHLLAIHHKQGVSNYLSGICEEYADLVIPNAIGGVVDFLPSGVVPPNPSELLLSERLEEMIAKLREEYDYVIVDNVPAMVVADAAIVNRVADATIYVMRDGMVDRRYLLELEDMYQAGKFNHMSIVLNDVKYPHGAVYGYGQSYGYGMGYGNHTERRRQESKLKRIKRKFKK